MSNRFEKIHGYFCWYDESKPEYRKLYSNLSYLLTKEWDYLENLTTLIDILVYLEEFKDRDYIENFCIMLINYTWGYFKYIPKLYQTQEVCLHYINSRHIKDREECLLEIHDPTMRNLIKLLTANK